MYTRIDPDEVGAYNEAYGRLLRATGPCGEVIDFARAAERILQRRRNIKALERTITLGRPKK